MSNTQLTNTSWQSKVDTSLSEVERYWLKRPGALTSGLRQVGEFGIEVLNEYVAYVKGDEAYPLGLALNQPIWVREILMSVNNHKAVYARSITELTASRAAWQGLRVLQARPLADILYNDAAISRGDFETTQLNEGLSLQRSLSKYSELPQGEFLARRSTFYQNNQGMTVNEVFLPGFWQELAKHPIQQQLSF